MLVDKLFWNLLQENSIAYSVL